MTGSAHCPQLYIDKPALCKPDCCSLHVLLPPVCVLTAAAAAWPAGPWRPAAAQRTHSGGGADGAARGGRWGACRWQQQQQQWAGVHATEAATCKQLERVASQSACAVVDTMALAPSMVSRATWIVSLAWPQAPFVFITLTCLIPLLLLLPVACACSGWRQAPHCGGHKRWPQLRLWAQQPGEQQQQHRQQQQGQQQQAATATAAGAGARVGGSSEGNSFGFGLNSQVRTEPRQQQHRLGQGRR